MTKLLARHLFLTATVGIALVATFSCTDRARDCKWNLNCVEEGGSGGLSEGGGTSNGGSSKGGTAGKGGTSSSTSGTTGPCGSCSASKPMCDVNSTRCVECLDHTDCTQDATQPYCSTVTHTCGECLQNVDCGADPTKTVCDADATTCVACLSNAECTTAAASRCDTGTNTCTICAFDSDCTQVVGKGVCSAGTCVACTVANETACGTFSCNPTTNACTTTPKNSVARCGACTADSECATGTGVTLARCVPMSFNGASRGSYCLEAVSSGCDQPFGSTSVMKVTALSMSGAASDEYCGINQNLVTCEAIRDMQDANNTIRCGNTSGVATDGLCGCHRNAAGTCTDPGVGGLCRSISGANRCTIPCSSGLECPAAYSCTTAGVPNYCG